MTEKFTTVFNRTIFVDANVILYHLFGESGDATDLLLLGENKRLRLVTSLRIVDEVIFKCLLWVARTKLALRTKTYNKLKKDKELVKKVTGALSELNLRKLFSIFDVIEPRSGDLWKSLEYSEKYGLFGNDALTLFLMRRFNLKYIATADRDFGNIEWLILVEGDWLFYRQTTFWSAEKKVSPCKEIIAKKKRKKR